MTQRQTKKGFLLTFEGGEGAGKSTQIRALVQWFKQHHISFEVTRQPGGSALGKGLRRLVLSTKTKNLSSRAELLLYEADRAQHVHEQVGPALQTRKVVVSDRFADSSTVYQGICRNLGVDWTEELNRFATSGLEPDLTIVLDVPVETGRERLKKRRGLDRIEREKADFHRNVRNGFLRLARRAPHRIKIVNGTNPKSEVTKEILRHLEPKLRRKGFRI